MFDGSNGRLKLAQSAKQLSAALDLALPVTLAFFFLQLLSSIASSIFVAPRSPNRLGSLVSGAAVVFLCLLSAADFGSISPATLTYLPAPVHRAHELARPLLLTSPYGLFRRMTGTGPLDAAGEGAVQRPELIVEVSPDGVEWHEVAFYDKPGNVSGAPRWIAPVMQNRLDWMMWFAALGGYQQNPWLLHLAVKILRGTPEVLALLPPLPLPPGAARFVRMRIYHYRLGGSWAAGSPWWERSAAHWYLPPVDLRALQQVVDQFPLWAAPRAGAAVVDPEWLGRGPTSMVVWAGQAVLVAVVVLKVQLARSHQNTGSKVKTKLE
eukprot:TRINITY_DN2614_c0_g1_i4.p1 TRINITY_DN2614_c0_g1~~TRINITY_DN2614_c0_g1_i4.p1  ORF type:complete len:323 (+),score=54.11 TRINITY_DN2614_c0_g1_i4:840-1808(+)